MLLQTSGSVAVPVIPAVTSSTIQIFSITFDLTAHTYMMQFSVPGSAGPGQMLVDQGTIPGALQTALENHCQARVEAKLGISGTTVQQA
jgi:hypothetical protein